MLSVHGLIFPRLLLLPPEEQKKCYPTSEIRRKMYYLEWSDFPDRIPEQYENELQSAIFIPCERDLARITYHACRASEEKASELFTEHYSCTCEAHASEAFSLLSHTLYNPERDSVAMMPDDPRVLYFDVLMLLKLWLRQGGRAGYLKRAGLERLKRRDVQEVREFIAEIEKWQERERAKI